MHWSDQRIQLVQDNYDNAVSSKKNTGPFLICCWKLCPSSLILSLENRNSLQEAIPAEQVVAVSQNCCYRRPNPLVVSPNSGSFLSKGLHANWAKIVLFFYCTTERWNLLMNYSMVFDEKVRKAFTFDSVLYVSLFCQRRQQTNNE